MDLSMVIISVLLGIITVLFGVSVNLVLKRIDSVQDTMERGHTDAMARLDDFTTTLADLAKKIDEHVRDHAQGRFK